MTDPAPGTPDFLERLLAHRIGLDVASVGHGVIEQGARTRMARLKVSRLEDYERILLGPGDEFQALVEEVVIPESWFFRDDRPFAALRELIRATNGPLSVLCLPCANGEEPYSVVMVALEEGLPRDRVQVVAVDISDRSLERAARGLYGVNAFRGMPDTRRAAFFEPTDTPGRFLLTANVRSLVEFRQGNLLNANLLADHPPFRIVFCRNLLIYFDEAARSQAFTQLDRLTAADGHLFLGHADRPAPAGTSPFEPEGEPGYFLFRKRTAPSSPANAPTPRPVLSPRLRATSAPPRLPQPRPNPAQPPTQRSATPEVMPSASVPAPVSPPSRPASAVATVAVKPAPSGAEETGTQHDQAMAAASRLADQGDYEAAKQLVRAHLGQGPLDAAAHFLLAMICQAAGDRPAAEVEFARTIYLDPNHDEALFALALLARRRGDVAAEALYRRRAERILSRKGGA